MNVFVSYARRDRAAVEIIVEDLRRAHHDVWIDEELTGGQSWWDTILAQIRRADLVVLALSPDLLKSRACSAEFGYARACRRPMLAVMVERVAPQMAPPEIANTQIIDYLEHTPAAAIGLMTALASVPTAQTLPDPLPPQPAIPMSYMNTYRERLAELSLTLQQQSLLLSELRAHLGDDNDRDVAVGLIGELRRRNDITESIGREIDALLATLANSAASTTSAATTTTAPTAADHEHTAGSTSPSGAVSAGWNSDPFNRHQQRYWDGARWTEHVADNGQRSVDPPAVAATPLAFAGAPLSGSRPPGYASTGPSSPASVGPFSTGAFVGLIVASLFCFGIVGLVVGLINVGKLERRSQAVWLIVIGAVSFFIGLAVATASSSSGSEF